jgi:drug/metabolite transporter (DMT)-like permease
VAVEQQFSEPPGFGRGFLIAFLSNLAVAVSTIPIADHWNARGGEEWSVGLVLAAAALTALLGFAAVLNRQRREWGAGALLGAILAPVTVAATFIWYFAILHGS